MCGSTGRGGLPSQTGGRTFDFFDVPTFLNLLNLWFLNLWLNLWFLNLWFYVVPKTGCAWDTRYTACHHEWEYGQSLLSYTLPEAAQPCVGRVCMSSWLSETACARLARKSAPLDANPSIPQPLITVNSLLRSRHQAIEVHHCPRTRVCKRPPGWPGFGLCDADPIYITLDANQQWWTFHTLNSHSHPSYFLSQRSQSDCVLYTSKNHSSFGLLNSYIYRAIKDMNCYQHRSRPW